MALFAFLRAFLAAVVAAHAVLTCATVRLHTSLALAVCNATRYEMQILVQEALALPYKLTQMTPND